MTAMMQLAQYSGYEQRLLAAYHAALPDDLRPMDVGEALVLLTLPDCGAMTVYQLASTLREELFYVRRSLRVLVAREFVYAVREQSDSYALTMQGWMAQGRIAVCFDEADQSLLTDLIDQ